MLRVLLWKLAVQTYKPSWLHFGNRLQKWWGKQHDKLLCCLMWKLLADLKEYENLPRQEET